VCFLSTAGENAASRLSEQAMSRPTLVRRERLTVTENLTAAPSALWCLLTTGTHVERWFPWVAATIVDDPCEGGLRRIELKDGSSFDEYIVLNDARSMTYQYYAPAPPLPIQHVIGTHRITPLPDGGAAFSWQVSFDVMPAAPPDIVAKMRELYRTALAQMAAAASPALTVT
jgi:Polyketide cyclase / dehydrase and lipid transport